MKKTLQQRFNEIKENEGGVSEEFDRLFSDTLETMGDLEKRVEALEAEKK